MLTEVQVTHTFLVILATRIDLVFASVLEELLQLGLLLGADDLGRADAGEGTFAFNHFRLNDLERFLDLIDALLFEKSAGDAFVERSGDDPEVKLNLWVFAALATSLKSGPDCLDALVGEALKLKSG